MRNLYFVQVNDVYRNNGKRNTYIPYAAGCIEAYCMKNPAVAKNFRFGRIVYCRDEIGKIVAAMDDPFMVLFSCSVWNTRFNIALAKAVKAAFPACYITFGGHHVSSDVSYLEKYAEIDFMTHRAGEEPTALLLEALAEGKDLNAVPNLSFRASDGSVVTTENVPQTGTDYPSPYLEGLFDDILQDDVTFSILFETNRGCPNNCSYCDWGALGSRVRLFPLEKVRAEIDWMVANKIDYIYCADANFCLFSRDKQIVDYIVESNRKYGYPKFFHVNFTKNRIDFVFDVSTKMVRCGLSKAQTISFQSLNEEVLRNIGRTNISSDHFRRLMRRYRESGIATYCELILGLPGETCDSFCEGLCSLIENGQHYAINVYPCELLPNSEMGSPAYRRRFGIESTTVPFRLMHATFDPTPGDIPEYAEFVTSTYSMTKEDWADSLLFASYIQGLHNLGLTRAVAIYLRQTDGVSYLRFYRAFIGYSAKNPDTLCGRIYRRIAALCRGVIDAKNEFVALCDGTDNILWGFDELVCLEALRDYAGFLREVRGWADGEFPPDEVRDALFCYQYDIIKKIGAPDVEIVSGYDFYEYFNNVYLNAPAPLRERRIRLTAHDGGAVGSFAQLARETVWYGRNRRETDYTGGHYKISYEITDQ